MELERTRRLEALFAEHGQAVRAYALRRIDRSTADDIVSEVFVVAFRRLEQIPEDALPWLLATARRVLANYRRAAGRREALTAQLSVLHRSGWRDEMGGERELLRALARLSERDPGGPAAGRVGGPRSGGRGSGAGLLESGLCCAAASSAAAARYGDDSD